MQTKDLSCEDVVNTELLFISTVVDKLDGWLDPFAAKRTADLLLLQEALGVAGALYEVGLFQGKYFALLARAALRTRSTIVGVDTFEFISEERFAAGLLNSLAMFYPDMAATLDAFRMTLIRRRSSDLGPMELRSLIKGGARFVSVDGSHDFDDVIWDLGVAKELLVPGGIVAIDDYLHPNCLGVTAATDRFLASTHDVVPFGFVTNKLFLCRPGWADRYRGNLERMILNDQCDPKGRVFKAHADRGPLNRRSIEACYCGYKVLFVPRE